MAVHVLPSPLRLPLAEGARLALASMGSVSFMAAAFLVATTTTTAPAPPPPSASDAPEEEGNHFFLMLPLVRFVLILDWQCAYACPTPRYVLLSLVNAGILALAHAHKYYDYDYDNDSGKTPANTERADDEDEVEVGGVPLLFLFWSAIPALIVCVREFMALANARGLSQTSNNNNNTQPASYTIPAAWRIYMLACVTTFALCALQPLASSVSLALLACHAAVRWLRFARSFSY